MNIWQYLDFIGQLIARKKNIITVKLHHFHFNL